MSVAHVLSTVRSRPRVTLTATVAALLAGVVVTGVVLAVPATGSPGAGTTEDTAGHHAHDEDVVAQEGDGDEDARAERLTVGISGFEDNLTPFSPPTTPDQFHELINLVHDTLYWSHYVEEPEPWLAESAEPNDDFTEWTVTLRENVQWHDGEPLTAEDVAFSYEYLIENAAGRYDHHIEDLPRYEDAEVLDEHTLRMDFELPAPQFETMPAADIPILPEHVWAEIDEPETELEFPPVGTGPYEVAEIVSDQRYVLQANEDYFLGEPLVGELVLPVIRDPSAAFAGLQTGELDALARPVPPQLLDELRDQDGVDVVDGTLYESVQLHPLTTEEPWSDPQLRKAFSRAIDRDDLVERVLQGAGQAGRDGYYHPDSQLALEEDEETAFDPDEAAALLDESGYEIGSDGLRNTPDGEPMSYEVLVSSFDAQHQRYVELIGEHLDEVGIELSAEVLDPAALRQRRGAGEYDLVLANIFAHAHTDPDGFYHFFGPGIDGPVFGGYDNEDFNELLRTAHSTVDDEERSELIDAQQEFFAAEVPALALTYPDGNFAFRPEAYTGWRSVPGHGVLTKSSFLPADLGPGEQAATAAAEDGLGGGLWWLVGALGLAALVAGGVWWRRRTTEELE